MNIAYLKKDKLLSIYVHNPSAHIIGFILFLYYSEKNMVEELLSLGSLSILNKKIHPSTESHSFAYPEKDVCVYYIRDRKETELHNKCSIQDVNKIYHDNYIFYYRNEWYCNFDFLNYFTEHSVKNDKYHKNFNGIKCFNLTKFLINFQNDISMKDIKDSIIVQLSDLDKKGYNILEKIDERKSLIEKNKLKRIIKKNTSTVSIKRL